MREVDIQRQILQYLQLRGIFCWRNSTGAMVREFGGHKHFYRFGCVGSPDIIGMMPDGRFLGVEVKAARGACTSDQWAFLEKIRQNGGIGIVARSIEEVAQQLNLPI